MIKRILIMLSIVFVSCKEANSEKKNNIEKPVIEKIKEEALGRP